jgi:hypothetical protein
MALRVSDQIRFIVSAFILQKPTPKKAIKLKVGSEVVTVFDEA